MLPGEELRAAQEAQARAEKRLVELEAKMNGKKEKMSFKWLKIFIPSIIILTVLSLV
jgi:hypothetical protein